VDRLVRHCGRRVRFWQCDNEPSNLGLTWAGTAAEYVSQLQVFHRAVKGADPGAAVVLGGAPTGCRPAPLTARSGGSSTGCCATAAPPSTCSTCTCTGPPRGAGGSGEGGAAGRQRTPEEAAMAGLYERMERLPPQLRMFMRGCPPELEAKRHRINCREVVVRNLLALAAGVRRTVCWNLAPDVPGYENPLSVMVQVSLTPVLIAAAD
jgi:hypothetical protein